MTRLTAFAVFSLLLFNACRGGGLSSVDGELRVASSTLLIEPTFIGATRASKISLSNFGRAPLHVKANLPSNVFSIPEGSITLQGAETRDIEVKFTPQSIDDVTATVVFVADNAARDSAIVSLAGKGLTPLSCSASNECVDSVFDPNKGACVESNKQEGSSCGQNNLCIKNGACHAGTCRGDSISCEDGDLCTTNACNPSTGCMAAQPVVCPNTQNNPCLVPYCDSKKGCGYAPASDGTRCGPNDCVTANVCMSGVCEKRPAVDGSVCQEATFCSAEAICHGTRCVASTSNSTGVLWTRTFSGVSTDGYNPKFQGHIDAKKNSYVTVELGDKTITHQLISLDALGQNNWAVPVHNNAPEYTIDDANNLIFMRSMSHNSTFEARSLTDGHVVWSSLINGNNTLQYDIVTSLLMPPNLVLVITQSYAYPTVSSAAGSGNAVARHFYSNIDAFNRLTGVRAWGYSTYSSLAGAVDTTNTFIGRVGTDYSGRYFDSTVRIDNQGAITSHTASLGSPYNFLAMAQSHFLTTRFPNILNLIQNTVVQKDYHLPFNGSQNWRVTKANVVDDIASMLTFEQLDGDYRLATVNLTNGTTQYAPLGYGISPTADERRSYVTEILGPIALQNRGYLILVDREQFIDPVIPDSGPQLIQFDSQLKRVATCSLPVHLGAIESMALEQGLLVLQSREKIIGVNVPNMTQATTGWHFPAGNNRHDGNVH